MQSYFGVNGFADPANGVHHAVATRAELQAYDPALYALVAEVFAGAPILGLCP